MTLFLTRLKGKQGVEITRIDKIMRNAVDSNEMVFENFEAFENEIVGEEGKGFRCLLDGLNPERIAVAQTCIGLGRGALNLTVQYAKDRIVFDRPIGKNQAVAHPLADSWIRLEAAELMTQKAARLFDEGKPCGPEANAAKFLGSEAGFEAADRAMQFHGGFSMATEYHVSRFWMEARHLKIAPISQADGAELHLGQSSRPAEVLLILPRGPWQPGDLPFAAYLKDEAMRDAVICEPIRTPVGRYGGTLRDMLAADLAATVVRNLCAALGLPVRMLTT